MNTLIINGRKVGPQYPPYLIAEMSANHNGNLDRALSIIREAKIRGADAIKIQTYRPESMTIRSKSPDFFIDSGLWAGRSLYELYDWASTPLEWHQTLFQFAKEQEITIFSSPFDFEAVDLLEKLGAPAYKIASFEAVDLELIKYVANTGKPMIISTGMANVEEIGDAVTAAIMGGCQSLALLHCVSGYPAPIEEFNLRTILDMRERFNLVIGLSDHSKNNVAAIASIALGASIVEKHFTLDKDGGGPDDSFSIEPTELEELSKSLRFSWSSLGKVNYERKASEESNLKFRRSLYFVKPLVKGQVIHESDIRSIRPGYGLAPKFYDQVIGKKVTCDIEVGTRVNFDILS